MLTNHLCQGFGHDCIQRLDCKNLHTPLTEAQGHALLVNDLMDYETCVCGLTNSHLLNQNQYGALVSFAYQSGCGELATSWHTLMEEKDFGGICGALPYTNTWDGLLLSRREKEAQLCHLPTNLLSGCLWREGL
jgi:lysozyme